METKMKEVDFNVLQSLCLVAKKLEKSELKAIKLKGIKKAIGQLNKYLGTTDNQTQLLACIYSLGYKKNPEIDINDISSFLNCNQLEILAYKKDFEQLIERKLIEKRKKNYLSKLAFANLIFSVSALVSEAILENRPIDANIKTTTIDSYEFVEKVSDLIEERSNESIKSYELFNAVEDLENQCPDLDIITKLKIQISDIEGRTIFYEVCDDLINNEGNSDLECTLKDIYESSRKRLNIAKTFIKKEHRLLKQGLIELAGKSFFSDTKLELTDKGLELLLQEDAKLYIKKVDSKDLLLPENISAKKMFYSKGLEKQIDFLKESLMEDKYIKLRNRMEQLALIKGVTAIFYGAPGTGKTETVYQLAKATGRSIMHVDISQTKSMWFGESEKKIKEIFNSYAIIYKDSEVKPILLFNEADAVFGKRKDCISSNVAQTENAIQNIILEEMEKLDGILIATTNLADNLDAAFERRFLFKVKFEKPTIEEKQKIWQNKLPWLNDTDTLLLATNYQFSGGEIDNIVRKITMDEVLTGVRPAVEQVISFCKQEKIHETLVLPKIGFR